LRHLAGRDRSRPDLAEAGRDAEREHAASPTLMAYFSAVALMIAPICLSAAVKAATDLLLGAGAVLAD
jgi:hypothetical protein